MRDEDCSHTCVYYNISWNNAVLASENVEITRNERDRRSEIDLESLKKVAAVSIPDQCVLIQLFDVSFETSFHFLAIGIAVVIGTDVAMDIVSRSRPRGVLANRSITSLPFSDNCVNQFFLPPPSPSFPFHSKKLNLPASSIQSNYKQRIYHHPSNCICTPGD